MTGAGQVVGNSGQHTVSPAHAVPSASREAENDWTDPRPNHTPPPWQGRFVVYRVFSATRCLYVGQTNNVEGRMAQHALTAHWRRDVARVRITIHPTRDDARRVEADEIFRLRPLGNIAGRGGRAMWGAQDYLDVIETVEARRDETPNGRAALTRLINELRRRYPSAYTTYSEMSEVRAS